MYSFLQDVKVNYTTKFLSDHGDFNEKLWFFKRIQSSRCRCRGTNEMIEYVLFYSDKLASERDRLRSAVYGTDDIWLWKTTVFLSAWYDSRSSKSLMMRRPSPNDRMFRFKLVQVLLGFSPKRKNVSPKLTSSPSMR